jgi:hypothetical protein
MDFAASHVDADPEDGEYLANLFLKGADEYLALCRFTDDQDDGHIEVEVSEQTRTTRDGIVRCSLRATELRLTVDEDAARDLGTDTEIVVRFAVDRALLERMAATLSSLFRDRMDQLEIRLPPAEPSGR